MSPTNRNSHTYTTTHSNYPDLGRARPATIAALLAAAVVCLATKVIGFALEVASGSELVPSKFGALLTFAIMLTWGALGTVAILNRQDRNTAILLDRIGDAIEEAGDRRATAATLAALTEQRSATPVAPRRPHLVES